MVEGMGAVESAVAATAEVRWAVAGMAVAVEAVEKGGAAGAGKAVGATGVGSVIPVQLVGLVPMPLMSGSWLRWKRGIRKMKSLLPCISTFGTHLPSEPTPHQHTPRPRARETHCCRQRRRSRG